MEISVTVDGKPLGEWGKVDDPILRSMTDWRANFGPDPIYPNWTVERLREYHRTVGPFTARLRKFEHGARHVAVWCGGWQVWPLPDENDRGHARFRFGQFVNALARRDFDCD